MYTRKKEEEKRKKRKRVKKEENMKKMKKKMKKKKKKRRGTPRPYSRVIDRVRIKVVCRSTASGQIPVDISAACAAVRRYETYKAVLLRMMFPIFQL